MSVTIKVQHKSNNEQRNSRLMKRDLFRDIVHLPVLSKIGERRLVMSSAIELTGPLKMRLSELPADRGPRAASPRAVGNAGGPSFEGDDRFMTSPIPSTFHCFCFAPIQLVGLRQKRTENVRRAERFAGASVMRFLHLSPALSIVALRKDRDMPPASKQRPSAPPRYQQRLL